MEEMVLRLRSRAHRSHGPVVVVVEHFWAAHLETAGRVGAEMLA
jgi:hypothetical protein